MAAVEILRAISEQKISGTATRHNGAVLKTGRHFGRTPLNNPAFSMGFGVKEGHLFYCFSPVFSPFSRLSPAKNLSSENTKIHTEGYRSGHNGAVLKTVRAQAHAGSNPAPSAIKETSFVYQGKRGFLVFICSAWYNHFNISGSCRGKIYEIAFQYGQKGLC